MRHRRLFRRKRSQILVALSGVIFIYAFATSIMQYNLALVADNFSSTYTIFGILMGLPWFFSLLTDIPVGALADRFGRKRTIILGLIGLGISGLLLYISHDIFWLFWVLSIFGIFEGFLTVAGMASVIAASRDGEEHRFIGFYEGTSEMGYVTGSLAAGAILVWVSWQSPFLIFSGFCFLAALLAWRFVPNDKGLQEPFEQAVGLVYTKDRIYFAEIREFFSVGKIAYIVGFFTILNGMWYEFLWAMEPVLIAENGVSPFFGGLALSFFMITLALFDYPIGAWMDKTQHRFFSIVIGLFIGAAGIAVFALAGSVITILLVAIVTGVGMSFFDVGLDGLFDTFSNHHRRGYMTGVWQAAEDVGFIIGPVIGGVLADIFGLRGSFVVFGALFFISSLWVFYEKSTIKKYENIAHIAEGVKF